MVTNREGLETKIWADSNEWIEDFSVTTLPFKAECIKEVN